MGKNKYLKSIFGSSALIGSTVAIAAYSTSTYDGSYKLKSKSTKQVMSQYSNQNTRKVITDSDTLGIVASDNFITKYNRSKKFSGVSMLESSNLKDGYGASMFEDSRGWLWLTGAGIPVSYSEDGVTWKHDIDLGFGQGNNSKWYHLQEDRNNMLYAFAPGKKVRYTRNGRDWFPAPEINIDNADAASLFHSSKNILWMMGGNNGQTPLNYTDYTSPNYDWKLADSSFDITHGDHGLIFEDSRGWLWATASKSKLKVSKDHRTWEDSNSKLTDGFKALMVEDNRGWLWLIGKGIPLQYTKDGLTWHDADSSSNIENGYNGQLHLDPDGKIWALSERSQLQYTIDGIKWVQVDTGGNYRNETWQLFYQNKFGYWLMKGGRKLLFSKDGISWTESKGSEFTSGLYGFIYTDSRGITWSAGNNYPLQYNYDNSSYAWNSQTNSDSSDFLNSEIFYRVNYVINNNHIVVQNYKWRGSKKYSHLNYREVTKNGDAVWKDFHGELLSLDNHSGYEFKWVLGTEEKNVDTLPNNLIISKWLSKPTITKNDKSSKTPLTDSTLDATIIFDVVDFNENYMDIFVSSGTLNANNNQISGLKSGEKVTVTVRLKSGKWFDGSSKDFTKELTAPIQTYSGLKKPVIAHSDQFDKTPSTTTSKDGAVGVIVNGFDDLTMNLSVSAGTYDPHSDSYITGLTSGQSTTLSFWPKSGQTWEDGTTNKVEKVFKTKTQTFVGYDKVTITENFSQHLPPTTRTSTDGEISFSLNNFIDAKMDINVKSDDGDIHYIPQVGKITGLKSGQEVEIIISFKQNSPSDIWIGNSRDPISIKIKGPNQNVEGVKKPSISVGNKKPPSTKTSKDGEISLLLQNFDYTTTEISFSNGKYDIVNKKITGLKSGEKVNVFVTLKDGFTWEDGKKERISFEFAASLQTYVGVKKPTISENINARVKPKTSTSDDGEIGYTLDYFDSSKFKVTINGGIHNEAEKKITGLHSNELVIIFVEPTQGNLWEDGTNDKIKIALSSPNQTIRGAAKVEIKENTNNNKISTTATSKDGVIGIQLNNFNANKMIITVDGGASIDLNSNIITGLTSGQTVNVTIELTGDTTWEDGTKEKVEASFTAETQSTVGLLIPTIESEETKNITPKTKTSKDGEIGIKLTDFDHDTMIIEVSNGNFDPGTNKVIGLTSGQKVKISIKPKGANVWTDGTTTTVNIEITAPSSEVVGVKKPALNTDDMVGTAPTTTTSKDGVLGYAIKNLDRGKVSLEVDGKVIDNINNQIEDLVSGQEVTFKFILKNGEVWTDGGTNDIIIKLKAPISTVNGVTLPSVIIDQTNTKEPTTISSTDGELGYRIVNFDSSKMTLKVNGIERQATGVVVDLASEQEVNFEITLKNNEVWTDGTNKVLKIIVKGKKQNETGEIRPTVSISESDSTLPKTSTSKDGTLGFILNNFDKDKMILKINNVEINNPDIVKTVNDLSSGQEVIFEIILKQGISWDDGSVDPFITSLVAPIQAKTGLIKPSIKADIWDNKIPTTSTSRDGILGFEVNDFDENRMTLKANGQEIKHDIGKIEGLTSGQTIRFEIELKPGNIWEDGTSDNITFELSVKIQTKIGIKKPRVEKDTIKIPTTITSTDGELSFNISNYNPAKINITVDNGTLDMTNKKVTGLSSGQTVTFTITPKGYGVWEDGTVIPHTTSLTIAKQTKKGLKKPTFKLSLFDNKAPKTASSMDGEIKFTIDDFEPDKMDISVDSGYLDFDNKRITGLSSAQKIKIIIRPKNGQSWLDGTNHPITYDVQVQTQTNIGVKKPDNLTPNPQSDKIPHTTSSKDGAAGFTLSGYDEETMSISASNGTIDVTSDIVTGLHSGQSTTITISLKGDNVWKDGSTTSLEIELTAPIQTDVGIRKPTIDVDINNSKEPSSKSARDGVIALNISDFDSATMEIASDFGTLDIANMTISGLVSGQNIEVVIIPKAGKYWIDGKRTPVKKLLKAPTQDHVGLAKPTITENSNKNVYPTTESSNNGVVGFEVTNFINDKMTIRSTKGNLVQGQNIVKDLGSGESFEIIITLNSGEFWKDGGTESIKVRFSGPIQTEHGLDDPDIMKDDSHNKTPSTSSSKDGLIGFYWNNYDETKYLVSVDHGEINFTDYSVSGLTSGQVVTFTVTPKGNLTWVDGSKDPKKITLKAPIQTRTGLTRPSITMDDNKNQQPKTSTSNDGLIGIELNGFIEDKMNISSTSGTVNITEGIIEDLSSGQEIQVTITPKLGELWTDGTSEPIVVKFIVPIQSITGIEIPRLPIDHNQSKKPTTSTSPDGKLSFFLNNYDNSNVDIEIDNGILDLVNQNVTGLVSGQEVKFTLKLKDGAIWTDGTSENKTITLNMLTQDYAGVGKPNLKENDSLNKQPKTSTSIDGVMGFTLTGFDESTMEIRIEGGGEINLDNGTITGLTSGQVITIFIRPNRDNTWTNGSIDPVELTLTTPVQTFAGIIKPKINVNNFNNRIPSSSTSEDGEVGIEILNFDDQTMTIVVEGGALSDDKKRIVNLKTGRSVKITIKPKANNLWTEGSDEPVVENIVVPKRDSKFTQKPNVSMESAKSNAPTSLTKNDGVIVFVLEDYDKNKVSITVDNGTLDLDNNRVTGLTSGQEVKFTFVLKGESIWDNWTKKPVNVVLRGLLYIPVGLSKPGVNIDENANIHPTTETSKDGEFSFSLINYDEDKMDVTIDNGILDLDNKKVTGLISRQKVTFTFTLKGMDEWTDGTSDPIKITVDAPSIMGDPIPKPMVAFDSSKNKMPSSKESNDGEIWFDISGYDEDKMNITSNSGKIDLKNKKVVGISYGQNVVITVSLKSGEVWTDKTSEPINFITAIEFNVQNSPEKTSSKLGIIIGVPLALLSLISFIIVVFIMRQRKKKNKNN